MSETENSRREFLKQTAAATGGLVLALSTLPAGAEEQGGTAGGGDVVLKLADYPGLAKVGGAQVVKTATEKVIVARTGEASFVACSAICTHKACVIDYDHAGKQFICPCHDAKFGLDGKVTKGPARKDLKAYTVDQALLVKAAK
jgi:Rieske Fe-S protein